MRLDYSALFISGLLGVFADSVRTIDDSNPSFIYLPRVPTAWWHANTGTCNCWANPDSSYLYQNTWHDATRRSDDPPVNITYVFTGVGIDVYVVLWDPPSLGDADTNLTFSIDGSVKGTFARKATVGAPGKFYYNSKVFSIEGLSDQGQHTLVVDLDPSVLILFDRVDVLTGTPDASGGGGTKSSSNLAGIIGGAVGGVVGILAIILGIFFFRRRWRSQQQPENTMEQSMGPRAAYLQPFSPAGAEHKVSPLAQELPWERDLQGFEFLTKERICSLSEAGVSDQWLPTVSNQTIIFTHFDPPHADGSVASKTVLFDISSNSIHKFSYTLPELGHYVVAQLLSPEENIIVRWQKSSASETNWIIEAADARTNKSFRLLTHQAHCEIPDIHASKWMNNHTIYIPDSGRKIITRWPILPKLHEPSIITPVSAIAQHKLLRFHFTADERWWVANGWTPGRQGGGTGLIEIRHVQSNQSRVVPGVACCIANVDVYDVRKELLVIADSSADKLSIRVEQLDPSAPGEPFKPVYISVDLLDPGDCPHVVKVFDHLPIIAVTTIHNAVYFFELHFGDYLFSQRIRPEEVWYNSVDQQSLLVHVISKGNIERVSVNTVDLIGYVRRVLKNDTLASGIAIRTGLSGAEDVIFDDMHREYRDIEDRHGP